MADVASKAARTSVESGEHAVSASTEAARATADAGERMARAGADLFESTAEAFEQLWSSSLDAASQLAERSAGQLARAMGLSGNQTQDATEQSSRNIEAIVQSSKSFADGFQSVSRELVDFSGERMGRNLEKMNAVIRSRTPHDFIAAHSELVRENLESFLQSSRRIAEASVRAADEATKRMTEAMEKQRRAA